MRDERVCVPTRTRNQQNGSISDTNAFHTNAHAHTPFTQADTHIHSHHHFIYLFSSFSFFSVVNDNNRSMMCEKCSGLSKDNPL